MKYKSFEFNLWKLPGSFGDLGTFFPLAIGYIAINGLDPAGLLVMMGLANVITGLTYRLPMPSNRCSATWLSVSWRSWPSITCLGS